MFKKGGWGQYNRTYVPKSPDRLDPKTMDFRGK